MKNIFIASLLFGLTIPALPARANPKPVATCLNKILAPEPGEVDSAQLTASVDHDGQSYHRIKLTYPKFRDLENTAIIYLRTDSKGGCENVLDYLSDSFPEEEEYKKRLGPDVYQKMADKLALIKAQSDR